MRQALTGTHSTGIGATRITGTRRHHGRHVGRIAIGSILLDALLLLL